MEVDGEEDSVVVELKKVASQLSADTAAQCKKNATTAQTYSVLMQCEDRVEQYLILNELLQEHDTPERLHVLANILPSLLPGFRHDIQQNQMMELTHVALRTLSYFMYHASLAQYFPVEHVRALVGDIIQLLAQTDDQVSFK